MCDVGYKATFDREKVFILEDEKVILEGERNIKTGLWEINVDDSNLTHQLNVLRNLDVKIKEEVNFLYQSIFSTNKILLLQEIKL